jgi:hypothetical protein
MAVLTINSNALINVIDQLTDAQIELHAIYLMANALQRQDTDAFQKLASGIDNTVECAKDALNALRVEEGKGNV